LWEKIFVNLVKSGQKLEKVSQRRGLRFNSNKYGFSKNRMNFQRSIGVRFFFWAPIFSYIRLKAMVIL
jgi:hypothetical protein